MMLTSNHSQRKIWMLTYLTIPVFLAFMFWNSFITIQYIGSIQSFLTFIFLIDHFTKSRKFYIIYILIIFHILYLNANIFYSLIGLDYTFIMTKFGVYYPLSELSIKLAYLTSMLSLYCLLLPTVLNFKYNPPKFIKLNFTPTSRFIIKIVLASLLLAYLYFSMQKLFFFLAFTSVEEKYLASYTSNPLYSLLNYIILPLSFITFYFDKKFSFIAIIIYLSLLLLPKIATFDRSSLLSIFLFYIWLRSIFFSYTFNYRFFVSSIILILILFYVSLTRMDVDFDLFTVFILKSIVSQSDTLTTLAYAIEIRDLSPIFLSSSIFSELHNFYLNLSGVSVNQSADYLAHTTSISHLLTHDYSSAAYFSGHGLGSSFLIDILSLYGADFMPIFFIYVFVFSLFIGYICSIDQLKNPPLFLSFFIFFSFVFISRSPLMPSFYILIIALMYLFLYVFFLVLQKK